MHRTVVNIQTGEVTEAPLTDEEIEQAKQQYEAWLAEQPKEDEE
jgi:hypothetical protein